MWRKKDAEIQSSRITVDTRECPFIDVNDFILFFSSSTKKYHFNVSGLLQVSLAAISLFCYYLFVENTRNVFILNELFINFTIKKYGLRRANH